MKIKLYLLCIWLMSTAYGYSQDIVVNEIMANPKNGQLPAVEYIELLNNSASVIDLLSIRLDVNKKSIQLPSYLLAPQQFVVLCPKEGEDLLANYGNVISFANWPSLNNSGATIAVYRKDMLIEELSYQDSWHPGSAQKAGGWSLERINPNWKCNTAANWSSSMARRGGTPGSPNSIADRAFLPKVEITTVNTIDKGIRIGFNMDRGFLPHFEREHFRIHPGNIIPTAVTWDEDTEQLVLGLDEELKPQEVYTLSTKELDICGVTLQIADHLIFNQPKVQYNDVVINEVLFNPLKTGSDFVELYNRTSLPINIQGWKLGNRIVSDEVLLLPAQGFLVLTAERDKIINTHANAMIERIHEMKSIPSYSNQQGIVTLFSPHGLVDSFYYNVAMHAPWINNPKGISLERQSYDEDSNKPDNFKSAATIVGGSTPGFRNSTATDSLCKKNDIFLTSKTVSPDSDGFEDELEINYILNDSDYLFNLNIYAETGRLVNRLIRQESGGSEGKITWDCKDEKMQKSPSGHYIYWLEIYRENGAREIFKGAFIIVHKTHHY
ncbi:MAG: lamin tail domain-containing protein [Sphingobacterium sp.]|jgi:hypothetical protein|nr:lamin tail domain-containing protein [Sphingobacterium sp.]